MSKCDRFDDCIPAEELDGSAPITSWTNHGVNEEASITLSAWAKYGHYYNHSHFYKLDKDTVSPASYICRVHPKIKIDILVNNHGQGQSAFYRVRWHLNFKKTYHQDSELCSFIMYLVLRGVRRGLIGTRWGAGHRDRSHYKLGRRSPPPHTAPS